MGLAIEADWIEAWGTWIGGLGTIGTLIYANIGLRREARRRKEEIQSLKDDRKFAEEAQARTVVLHQAQLRETGRFQLSADLGNYGAYPITHVYAHVVFIDGGSLRKSAKTKNVKVLPPNDTHKFSWFLDDAFADFELPKLPWVELQTRMRIEVMFTDVHGLVWAMDYGGTVRGDVADFLGD